MDVYSPTDYPPFAVRSLPPPASSRVTGLFTKPTDSLLLDRALDYPAGGPAPPDALVSHLCQQPRTPVALAERMAEALLGGVREIAREPDGRYRLASMGEREMAGLLAGEAGRRV